jgi:single-stranded-DNA-specific exonuclease
MMTPSLPRQRWKIAPEHPQAVQTLIAETGLSSLLAQVLINRGITTPALAQIYCQPESQRLPDPLMEFPDLSKSVELLTIAIREKQKIAICGDYDADGMTSTALLLRALRHLGADVDYAIPSRMKDGYGINERIVREFAASGIQLILTVDNGIAAYGAIALAVDLGLRVIITDHHDLPEKLPPADAILNPKLLPEISPYYGIAGVGVAYILAIATAQKLEKIKGLTESLLELYTLGTIADLAPLVGVNRRWLKRGLKRLPHSQIKGIQALIQLAGVNDQQKALKPDDIGFRLGPRINAIGRIGDPQVVIELLTTEDEGIALERAMQCEQINKQRQELCEQIETEAIAYIESASLPWEKERVLVVVQPHWHHGVIGIVASRLVERYGVPVFIGTEEEGEENIRGSARSIDEFHIFEALVFCQDLLGKFGGHRAAGGFSLPSQNLAAFQERLSTFANQCLEPEQLKPLIKIDAQANFSQLTFELCQQVEQLQPWGIGNEFPIFWTPQVRILEQRIIGKNHLRLELLDSTSQTQIGAIAWRWGEYFPLPSPVDIAYKLQENHFKGDTTLQLELVGIRLPLNSTVISKSPTHFDYQGRIYRCSYNRQSQELKIQNDQGKVLALQLGQTQGLMGSDRATAKKVNLAQAPYAQLIALARATLSC